MPTPKKPSKPVRGTTSRTPARSAKKPAPKAAKPAAKSSRSGGAASAAAAAKKKPAPRTTARGASSGSGGRTPRGGSSGSRPRTRDVVASSLRDTRSEDEERPSLVDAIVEEEDAIEARPVAIGGSRDAIDDLDGEDTDDAATPSATIVGAGSDLSGQASSTDDGSVGPEAGLWETLAGVAALVLAGSVFLPWYKSPSASIVARTVTGWASGTWGPIILFLAIAAALIVALRKAKVAVRFPVGTPLVLEGIGWLSVVGILLKRWLVPNATLLGPLEAGMGLWVALGAAFALAWIAGRLSKDTPVVLLPNALKEPGGKLGIGLVALALIGGLFFGLTNESVPTFATPGGGIAAPTPVRGMPKCAREAKIPAPKEMRATTGLEPGAGSTCSVQFQTKLSVAKAFSTYKAALKAAGYKFTENKISGEAAKMFRQLNLTAPRCGIVVVSGNSSAKERQVQVVLNERCFTTPSPTP